MFLSKLMLNLRNSKARHDIGRTYEMHRSLMNAYPHQRVENRCDLLFRVEPTRAGPPCVLVQTRDEPDWSSLPAGYLLELTDCKPLDFVLRVGQRLRFRLRANPTKRVAAKNESLGSSLVGKRIGLCTETDQINWLLGKAHDGGFAIPGEWVEAKDAKTGAPIRLPNFRVDAIPEGRDRNSKPGHEGEFVAVRFDGLLVVSDPIKLRSTLASGIGSAKAFGFGLLSLAPSQEGNHAHAP